MCALLGLYFYIIVNILFIIQFTILIYYLKNLCIDVNHAMRYYIHKLIGKAFIRVTYHNPELPDEAVRMTKTLLLS